MPLTPITEQEFREVAHDPYFEGRLGYYREAIWLAERCPLGAVLEFGCHRLPLFHGSDTLDVNSDLGTTFVHDAKVLPWPVERHYDLAIGLQVWEHLHPQQAAVFEELRRIADNAILSVPYNWKRPDDPEHSAIDEQQILYWTGGLHPTATVLDHNGTTERLVCWWNFR